MSGNDPRGERAMSEARTVAEMLRRRAEARPDSVAHVFLGDGERESARLTYAQLDARASAVAASLARMGATGERVLLLFPPGLEFISAFFGCLYARAIAVPAYLPEGPDPERGLLRLAAIARDCGATHALTTGAVAEMARAVAQGIPELAGVRWTAVDGEEMAAGGERWDPPLEGGLAFLQYTSGSTRTPAGVRVTHANLLHNLSYGNHVERNDAESVSVSWLPVHHDMGLIEGTLLPVYGGYPAYLMAPASFLQRPARWLNAVTRYRATNSGGPNFAYELCVRKVTGEAREALDLSSWRTAYNGSEPVRAETLERFHAAFSPRGFRQRAFHPVYGLAEATLIVSGVRAAAAPKVLELDARALERGEVRCGEPAPGVPSARLVGAGVTACGVEVRIADPETREEQPTGRVGEIWLRSASVADGYWERQEETAQVFQARLADGDGPFLRTGDLGFVHEGEVFVAGRLKDLVIVRGRNHFPQDIERTVEAVHPAIRPGCLAAFAISRGGEEQLAVVAEVNVARLEGDLEALGAAIRTAVAAEHGVMPGALYLVPPHTVHKTSSGKIARRACREALKREAFDVLWRWEAPVERGGLAAYSILVAHGPSENGSSILNGAAAAHGPSVNGSSILNGAAAAHGPSMNGSSVPNGVPVAHGPSMNGSSVLNGAAAVHGPSMNGSSILNGAAAAHGPSMNGSSVLNGAAAVHGAHFMTGAHSAAADLVTWLKELVAAQLGVRPDTIDPRRPLAHHGLGSLDTLSLLGALSERTGREIPVEALASHPDLESLAALASAPASRPTSPGAAHRRMCEDAFLADDVWPPERSADPSAPFLLTGATGFLGAHLLHDLLERSARAAVCLVRAASAKEGALRVRRAMEAQGLWSDSYARRIRCVPADLAVPGLGLSEADRLALARDTSEIFHSAAAVNWVYPYEALRASNVESTRQLLGLACSEVAKPFHFVSTQLVCYGTGGPRREVTEEDDFLDEIGGLHLGYAQSKCVAERLVQLAGARGLPTRIYRPPFLLGSSRSGHCSTDDFLAALIKGCVQLGSAPDLDWDLDCCPVDFLSALIAEVAAGPRVGSATIHPPLPKARHWRECVLWMNLFGYRLKLRPYAEWLRELERAATGPEHALYFLRPFFLTRLDIPGGYTRPELYETPFRNAMSSAVSRARLAGRLPECPRLDAPLLERYFRSWIDRGHLPPVARAAPGAQAPASTSRDSIASAVRRRTGGTVELLGACGGNSITGELTAWKHARGTGMFRYRVRGDGAAARTMVIKAKASGEEVVDVAAAVAGQCGERLGEAVRRHASLLGFDGCHHRELQIYAQRDPRFTDHAPAALFIERDDARGLWLLGLEDLSGRTWSAERASAWGRAEREAAVRGLASLHAIGFPHGARGWPALSLAPERTARRMAEGAELWAALEEHARGFFTECLGEELSALHRRLITSLERWWRPMEDLPRTLIHNDFNTRNIMLRRTERGPRLCAYDWELATVGIPQRDLAELLAFTLDARAGGEEIDHYVELHRRELEHASGQRIDKGEWAVGLAAALGDLLVSRLSLYTLVHRFQRQAFLPEVVRTWARLHAHLGMKASPRRAGHGRTVRSTAEAREP